MPSQLQRLHIWLGDMKSTEKLQLTYNLMLAKAFETDKQ